LGWNMRGLFELLSLDNALQFAGPGGLVTLCGHRRQCFRTDIPFGTLLDDFSSQDSHPPWSASPQLNRISRCRQELKSAGNLSKDRGGTHVTCCARPGEEARQCYAATLRAVSRPDNTAPCAVPKYSADAASPANHSCPSQSGPDNALRVARLVPTALKL